MKLPCGLLALLLLCAALAAAEFEAGEKLEIRWGSQWYPGEVIEVKDGRYKVRYDGYSAAWDEWTGPERLRSKAGSAPAVPATPGRWRVGDRVEALSYGAWYKGTISAVGEAQWLVAYDGFGRSADEWRKADQIRLPGTGAVAAVAATPGRAPVAATPPAGAKAGIAGAFLRVETYYFNGSLSLSNQGWFFTKDGRFSKSPSGGFDFADFTPQGDNAGTYWIADGRITFAFADGSEPLAYAFEAKPDELVWGGLGSTRVEGFPQGWRLDGKYEGGASVGGGALMSSTTLVFRRDGTFHLGSIASFKTGSERSVVSGGSSGAAAGRYEFDGFTLTLTHAGGEVQKFTVFAFSDKDASGRPEYIYRDGTMMRRQE